MTAPTAPYAAQMRDLRQLAGVGAYTLWLSLYVTGLHTEAEEIGALLARNAGDLRLAAADLLDGVIDGAETIKKLKLDGELEVEFNPVSYAEKSIRLRGQVYGAAARTQRFGPPAAGMMVGRSPVPQAFALGNSQVPEDLQRLGAGPNTLSGREQP